MSKSHVRAALVVAGIVVVGLCAGVISAQTPTFTRTELQRGDLSAGPREAVQSIVVFQPKGASGRHTHPGEELGYILEGTLRFEKDGEPPVTKKAGEYFMVPAGKIHGATNVGPGVARVLATYVVEKGKPIATPAP
jgi:quercetin dioxygenase-like cupin family protein